MQTRFFSIASIALVTVACGSSGGGSGGATTTATGQGAAGTTGAGGGGAGTGTGGTGTGTGGSGAGTTGTGGSGATTTGTGHGAAATQADGKYFPGGAPYYTDVSSATLAADSSAITKWMVQDHPPSGWGTSALKVDFSIVTVDVPAGTAKRTYQTVTDFYYVPDCDDAPVPVPQGGAVEETYGTPTDLSGPFTGYNCGEFANGADCHMLFLSRSENRLYELYHGTIDGSNAFQGGCLAIWDTSKVYGADGRGQQCTSADAAGLPIAPLLFTPEEIQAGVINHAIRFILPNGMIRTKKYVTPATHGTNTSGPVTAPPYGVRMRLSANYPLSNLSPAAQVVAKALQKYGMILADGGNITLVGQSDLLSKVKWADVGFDANSLNALKATDFEVLDYGIQYDVTYDCQRTQLTQ